MSFRRFSLPFGAQTLYSLRAVFADLYQRSVGNRCIANDSYRELSLVEKYSSCYHAILSGKRTDGVFA